MQKKFVLVLASAALLAGSIVTLSAQQKKADAPAMKLPPVSVVKDSVIEMSETGSRKYVGTVSAYSSVSLVARAPGYILQTNFKEGEMVEKGQLLYQIEDTTYQAAVKSAEAKYKQIQAEYTYAKAKLARQKELSERKIVSQENFEDAERLFRFYEARILEMEAALIDARNTLSYTRIVAPVGGRISKSVYSNGNYVTINSGALADIAQIVPVKVRFAISENDYLSMFGSHDAMKNDAVVRVITADRRESAEIGSIEIIDNKVDSSTGTIMVWAVFQNVDNRLNPGGLVTVVLSKRVPEKKAAIQLSAVQTDIDGNFVYVLDAENHAVKRPVKVGEPIGKYQIIESGLKAGESVIIDGAHKVMMPGMTVIPVPDDASGK